MKDEILKELQQSRDVLDAFMTDEDNIKAIENAASIMINCIKNGGKIVACGNGGSMSDAMHFASELTGRYRKDRRPLPAIAISDPGHISCVGNDYGYDEVFARFVDAHGKKGDVLLALTTSGNSYNICNAITSACAKGMYVVLLTGKTGGRARDLIEITDVEINIPYEGAADRVQECGIVILHTLCLLIEQSIP